MDGEPQLDRYLLQFWPAPPGPDRILKQTSLSAAHWHRYARELPPPTPAERAEAERRARLAEETAQRERRLAREGWEWGGRPPSQALRDVGGNVRGLLPFDPALLHALDASGPVTQRAVALLAARRACEAAGLTTLDWVAGALTALAEGRPLPPPFDDDARMWQTLATDPRVPDRTVGHAVPPERPPFRPPLSGRDRGLDPQEAAQAVVGPAAAVARTVTTEAGPPPTMAESPTAEAGRSIAEAEPPTAEPERSIAGADRSIAWSVDEAESPTTLANPPASDSTWNGAMFTVGRPNPAARISQPYAALPAITGAAESDPLQAALDAVYAAVVTYGEDHPALLAEVRSAVEGRRS
ncbi:hypothetical protein [Streptomyces sp. NPDC050546]|uniref:hypothetical protein n=1 Tax=Streptomyces sp. NPDC050546 TaxID=3365628 RepID=UPI00378CF89B